MAGLKLLLTGATGYVGGTVLTQLQNSNVPEIKALSISVLVRKQEQADVLSAAGVTPIVFTGLEDLALLRRVAGEHDIVVHTADSTNPAAVEALVLGLADGKAADADRHFIHLSGTSSLGDHPITRELVETREFSDKNDDLYGYMKQREAVRTYTQRATDVKTVEIGEQTGVKTYVLKIPIIYGRGTGLFHNKSFHIPALIKGAIAAKQAEYIGDGAGVWDYVHVVDAAEFFELLLARILTGRDTPSGRKGLYFVRALRQSWKALAEGMGKAGHELGILEQADPKSISLKEAAEKYTRGDEHFAEIGLASNSRTAGDLAREMGWRPKKDEADLQRSLLEDFELVNRS